MNEIKTLNKETIDNFLEFMAFFEHAKILKEKELIVNRFTAPTFNDATSIRKRLSQTILMRMRDELSLSTDIQRGLYNTRQNDDLQITISTGEIERKRRRTTDLISYFEMCMKINYEINFANLFHNRDPDFFQNIKIVSDRNAKSNFIKGIVYRSYEDIQQIMDNYELLIVKCSSSGDFNKFSQAMSNFHRVNISNIRLPDNSASLSQTDRSPSDFELHDISYDSVRNAYWRNMNSSLAILKYYYGEQIDDECIFNDISTASGSYGNNFVISSNSFTEQKFKNFYFCCGDVTSHDKFLSSMKIRELYNRTAESVSFNNCNRYISSLTTSRHDELLRKLRSDGGDKTSKYMFILSRKEKNELGEDVCYPFSLTYNNKHSLKLNNDSILNGDTFTSTMLNLKNMIRNSQLNI